MIQIHCPAPAPDTQVGFQKKISYIEAKLAKVTCHESVTPIASLNQSQDILNSYT